MLYHGWGFPADLVVENPPANAGNIGYMSSIPGSGRSPGRGNGNPLQYSCLKNTTDRGAWQATVHEAAKESDLTERLNTDTHAHTNIYIYTTWLNLRNMLSERNQAWKGTYVLYDSTYMKCTEWAIQGDRKQFSSFESWEAGGIQSNS